MRIVLMAAALLAGTTLTAEAVQAGGKPGGMVGGGTHTSVNVSGGNWNGGRGGNWSGRGVRGGGGFSGGYFGGWSNGSGGGWNSPSWYAITGAPGGWNSYYRPTAGWTLPHYWLQSGFAVDDWEYYRFKKPRRGYHWSRYYNDAVLVNDRGRVIDIVYGVEWDRYGRDGAGYRDDRYDDGGAPARADDYSGRWEGTWYGDDGRRYSGAYDGRYQSVPEPEPYPGSGTSYAPPPAPDAGHGYSYGASSYGYGAGGYAPVTVTVNPGVTTTTTTTTTEYITETVPVRRVVKRRKARCTC